MYLLPNKIVNLCSSLSIIIYFQDSKKLPRRTYEEEMSGIGFDKQPRGKYGGGDYLLEEVSIEQPTHSDKLMYHSLN
jgi:hypothetical protein